MEGAEFQRIRKILFSLKNHEGRTDMARIDQRVNLKVNVCRLDIKIMNIIVRHH